MAGVHLFQHNALAAEVASLKNTVQRLEAKINGEARSEVEESGGDEESGNGNDDAPAEVEEPEDDEPANLTDVEAKALTGFGRFRCPAELLCLKRKDKCNGQQTFTLFLVSTRF